MATRKKNGVAKKTTVSVSAEGARLIATIQQATYNTSGFRPRASDVVDMALREKADATSRQAVDIAGPKRARKVRELVTDQPAIGDGPSARGEAMS